VLPFAAYNLKSLQQAGANMPKDSRNSNGGFFSSFFHEKTYLGFFVLLRFYVGYKFLNAGLNKYLHGYLNPSGETPLKGVLQNWLSGSPPMSPPMPEGWFRSFIDGIVLPNAHTFGILVTLGEMAAGALLILGLATRFAGVLGAFLAANFFLATAHAAGATGTVNQLFVILNLLLAAAAAGRAWGVDYYLHRAWPKLPLW
jgi:thiosulfate dehydrogenase [quinone] large subunit